MARRLHGLGSFAARHKWIVLAAWLVVLALVIGGDVVHYASGLDDHRFPVLGDDFEAQAASADRLRALRDAGATVTPGHDPEVIRPGPLSS